MCITALMIVNFQGLSLSNNTKLSFIEVERQRNKTACIFFKLYIYSFSCVGSSLLRVGFLQLQRTGATLHCGARASHCGGFSCGAWASRCTGFSSCSTWAQQLWLAGCRAQAQQLQCMGLVALQHVGSFWTRDQTRVPCIGRWILNHRATREVHERIVLNMQL